jgi:hypothetical protein
MPHYFGTIFERNREQEYTIPVVFTAENDDDAASTLDAIASGWYTYPDPPEDGADYSFGDGIFAGPDACRLITDEEFEVLRKYLGESAPPKFHLETLAEAEETDESEFADIDAAFAAAATKSTPSDWTVTSE